MRSVLGRWGDRALPPLPPLDRRVRWCLLGVTAVAAVLRVAWATRMAQPVTFRDASAYLMLGDNLAKGEGYSYLRIDELTGALRLEPSAYYPPGYPLALGAVFWFTQKLPGDITNFGAAIGLNVVLSVLLVPLVFSLGRRLAGPVVGLLAAVATAVWPNLVYHSGIVLTETLFLVVLVALLVVALATPAVARAPGRWRLLSVGALLGVVGLIRPVSLVIAPLFVILWWSDGVVRALKRLAVVAVGTLVVLVPWAVLSTVRMDSPVLLSLNFGDNICIGYRDGASGGFAVPSECFDGYEQYVRPEYETRRQSDNIERALTYIGDHPLSPITGMPDRARYTLDQDGDGALAASDYGANPVFEQRTTDLLRDVADWYYYVLSAAAIAGIVVLVRRGLWAERRWQLLILSAPVSLVSPLLTFGDPRFKMPMYPVIAVCAAVAVTTLLRRRDPLLPAPAATADTPAPAPARSPGNGRNGDTAETGDTDTADPGDTGATATTPDSPPAHTASTPD